MNAPVQFRELFDLQSGAWDIPRDTLGIVYSRLTGGSGRSGADGRLGLAYVHEGEEIYSYGGRDYRVGPGHFLLVPPDAAGTVAVVSRENEATAGVCMFLPGGVGQETTACLRQPLVLSADAFGAGRLVASSAALFTRRPRQRQQLAESLGQRFVGEADGLVGDIADALEALGRLKPETRVSRYQSLERARSCLHAIHDRPVALAELAAVAGVSQFHLARNFRAAFGLGPGAYHRAVRLARARDALKAGAIDCLAAAHRYGFGDRSTFSRAYRRQFGASPRADIAANS